MIDLWQNQGRRNRRRLEDENFPFLYKIWSSANTGYFPLYIDQALSPTIAVLETEHLSINLILSIPFSNFPRWSWPFSIKLVKDQNSWHFPCRHFIYSRHYYRCERRAHTANCLVRRAVLWVRMKIAPKRSCFETKSWRQCVSADHFSYERKRLMMTTVIIKYQIHLWHSLWLVYFLWMKRIRFSVRL
jgi:hypothetical protein